jgi:probable F420-dependent oxidoreductase
MKDSVRFGVVLPVYGQGVTWESILRYAKEADKLGYDSLWISDHLLNPYLRERDIPDYFRFNPCSFEVWTTLSALAVKTKCRLGTYVICNNFRHPSILAKMATTLDVISGGRIDLGIGACWFKEEFMSFGIPWKRYQVRLEMLREGIKVIKTLMSEKTAVFTGKYYRIQGTNLEPKPVQRPHIPIWIGGSSKKIMEIVAEMGDGWIPEGLPPKDFSEGVDFIRRKARDFGRDPDKIIMAWGGGGARTIIAKDREVVEKMAEPIARAARKSVEHLPWIIGTPDQCIRRIEELMEAEATRIVAGFADFPSLNGLRLFSQTVIPYFSQG